MVIPPPLPDADPDPDIRGYHHDANTSESPHPSAAANVIAQAQEVKSEQPKAATDLSSPDSIQPRPSFVSTIDDAAARYEEDESPLPHFTLWQSAKNMIRGVPILFMVPLLCPVAWGLHFSHQNPVAVFVVSVLAIIPLAGGLSFATEELALRVGDAWGGLLNATFGNMVEVIVAILALVKGDLDIVQASMAGSILSNILLVLGMSYFAGGLRFHEQLYGVVGAQSHITLLGISIVAILLPEAFHLAWPDTEKGAVTASVSSTSRASHISPEELKVILSMSRGLSFILLAVYAVYLTFILWTHAYLFKSFRETPITPLPAPYSHRVFPRPQWVPSLRTVMSRDTSTDRSQSRTPSPPPTATSGSSSSASSMRHMQASARTPTRVHDFGAPDPHAGHKHAPKLALPSPILNSSFREHPPALRLDEEKSMRSPVGTNGTHVSMVDVERGIVNNRREVHHPLPQTSAKFAFFALAVFTALAGVTAECLVDSIDGMTEATNVSREFIGLVVLPVVGNSVEHITAVTVSLKDRLNLSLSIAVGSSVQVSLCLVPLLVLLGWCIGQPMSLLFDTYETICLVFAVVLVNFALSGRTNYLQGFTLMCAWVMIATVTWFYHPAH